jgi:predicted nucleic acid-binding protein
VTVVVADTSPLNYLVLIGQIEILQVLYGRVIVPPEVLAELADNGAPPGVLDWIRSRPEWLQVRAPHTDQNDPALQQIDPGERAAILLAQEELDVLLLIDDAAGRAEADRLGIPNTGTLGVLRAAALRRLLDLPSALNRLAATNFRVPQSLIEELLAEDLERKRGLEKK